MQATRYVLGFAFSTPLTEVILIEKARPVWQAGLLNGVGGHIEERECPVEAMSREMAEETGLYFPHTAWRRFGSLRGPTFEVVCFHTRAGYEVLRECYKRTDETPIRLALHDAMGHPKLLPNLRWLLPMAREHAANGGPILEIVHP